MLFLDKLNHYRIILFSGSPRRKELLDGAGIQFNVLSNNDITETYPDNLKGAEIARYLSELKAENYPLTIGKNDVIITADTIVLLDDHVFGKPKNKTEATMMLKTLSGRSHSVITSFTIRTATNISTSDVQSSVTFKDLDDDEIEYYIDKYRPFDKAGAYGIQEWIGYVGIERIEGSFYNVVGLPIHEVCHKLKELLK
ncbi:MAG: Maf family nucleotide pyrophosphatase [Rikenellaceae bacterium]